MLLRILLFALLLSPVLPAAAQNKAPMLAILELDHKGNVSADDASTLTDRLRVHMLHANTFQILERSKMEAILKEQGFQQSAMACGDDSCSVQLGRLLGVRYLMSGSVSRVDNLYVLNARLLDVERGLILREEYLDCECSLKEVLTQGTLKLVLRILKRQELTRPPSSAQPDPQPSSPSHQQPFGLPNLFDSGNPAGQTIASQPAAIRVSTPGLSVWTLAGTGWGGMSDGAWDAAYFKEPSALALLKDGSWIIADSGNHRIRQLKAGQVMTYSGLSAGWFGGFADGPADQARFNHPSALISDAKGVVYVADTDNHRIRKILPDGQVITLAGTGEAGFKDGNAATAMFNRPQGLALDPKGNLIVADTDNHAIRKVTPLGVVTTLAGDGQEGFGDGQKARFRYPSGLVIDPQGQIYLADTFNHRICRLSPAGVLTVLAGSSEGFADGPAFEARFSRPRNLALAPDGRLFIADSGNHRIRQLANGQVQTLAGTGIGGFADGNQAVGQFNYPMGLYFLNDKLYLTDRDNQRLRVVELKH